MSDDIKAMVVGRWTAIFQRLGIEVGDGRHIPCPLCGKPGKSNPFRYDNINGLGSWFCSYCGAGDGWGLLMRKYSLTFADAAKEVTKIIGSCEVGKIPRESKASPESLRNLFLSSKPLHYGDVVSFYLQNRSLSVYPNALRTCLKCYESETRQKHIAMLAIVSAADGQAITIHRTYIDEYGCKLKIEEPRKIMPSLKGMAGSAVRLFPLAGKVLGVATGIETSIAAHELFRVPVWATLNDALLQSFVPPDNIEKLFIFGDNDRNYAGQAAAYELAKKMSIKRASDIKDGKFSVLVCIPTRSGSDWNDAIKLGGEWSI